MGTVTTAVLRLDVEGGSAVTSEIRKATADLKAAQKDIEKASVDAVARIEAAQKAASERARSRRRRDAAETVQETRQTVAQQGGLYRQGASVAERAEQLVTRSKLRELAKRGEEQKKWVDLYKAAHAQATAAFEAEVGKRGNLSQRERYQIETAALAIVATHERAERARTAATEREDRRRRAVWGRRLEQGAEAVGAGGRAAGQVAGMAHDARQQARGERATVDHTVNAALFQAGIAGAEATSAREQIRARAHALGMDPQQLAEGLREAQTQFGVLSAPTREGRQARLRQQLDLAEFAQSTYQDPSEVMRVAGMLGQQGITGPAQRQALLSMTGIANAGSVELRDIVSQGLGPLMQNIAIATGRLGPTATPAQRSAAVQEATLRTMAMQEVASRGGGSIRASMNAFAAMERAMVSPRTATNLRASLAHQGFTEAQIGTVLTRQRNPRSGRMEDAFRSTDSLQTLSNLNTLFRGDTTGLINALSAGGHGLPTVMLSNIRTLAGTLNSQTENGETVQQRVARMRSEGAQFTEANVEAGRKMVQAEDATKLERQRQDRQGAFLDSNTQALNRMSDQLAAFQARNPGASAAVPVLATAGAGVLGATGSAVVAGALGVDAQSRAVREGRTFDGRQLSPVERASRLAGQVLLGPIASTLRTGADMYSAAQSPRGLDALLDALPGRIAAALREAPLTASVSAGDAAHAATSNAGNGGR